MGSENYMLHTYYYFMFDSLWGVRYHHDTIHNIFNSQSSIEQRNKPKLSFCNCWVNLVHALNDIWAEPCLILALIGFIQETFSAWITFLSKKFCEVRGRPTRQKLQKTVTIHYPGFLFLLYIYFTGLMIKSSDRYFDSIIQRVPFMDLPFVG